MLNKVEGGNTTFYIGNYLEVNIPEGALPTPTDTSTPTLPATETPTVTPTLPPAQPVNAKYFYDGDGAMVKSIVNGVITYYPGRHFNKTIGGTNQKIEKYYTFASLTIAIRVIENGVDTLQWLLVDHLGSTSVTANSDGTLISTLKYSAFGETWASNGNTSTQFLYTGQLSQTEIGLYFYNARWYDPSLGRFVQADTIVPGVGNARAWDKFIYVLNNPINGIDPTGHATCDDYGNCYDSQGWHAAKGYTFSKSYVLKKTIWVQYGILMSDNGDKEWDVRNLQLMKDGLQNIDESLNGQLKSLTHNAIFRWDEYVRTLENCPRGNCTYQGETFGTLVSFQTMGNAPIRQINIYHEYAHVLDNSHNTVDVFSYALKALDDPSFITDDQYLDTNSFIDLSIKDPYYGTAPALQHVSTDPIEQWGDIFANYVAGNIYTGSPKGIDKLTFVTSVLASYVGVP